MELKRSQFDVLTCLEKQKDGKRPTQRSIAQSTGLSVGTVNGAIAEMEKVGWISNGTITAAGVSMLEPYRVRRAIFLAAGFGERLIPITLNTPKPLVRVRGVRMIDTMLDAVVEAGIEEIIIIRGYLSEQFDQLLYKYPQIRFIENPIYGESNNISSVMCVRYMLKGAYVFEGDLFLYNKSLITKYQYQTNYLGIPVEVTDDWCFESKSGIITKFYQGGRNCHMMVGISYWSEPDGARMAEHVKLVYESPGGKERFWDQVPLEYYIKEYKIAIRECQSADVTEIDTYAELKKLDESYR